MIGDLSSEEDEKDSQNPKLNLRESVKNSKNFFERMSKGQDRDETPDFKRSKKNTIRSTVGKSGKINLGGKNLKTLFQTQKLTRKVQNSQSEKKRINIFSTKKSEHKQEQKEIIIGDSSSDEEEKKNQNFIERNSIGRLSSDYGIGAKEGVVQSINLDVATLSNFHEARIKSQGMSQPTLSDKDSKGRENNMKKNRHNIFTKTKSEGKGTSIVDLFKKKEKIIDDIDEEKKETQTKDKMEAIEEQNEEEITYFLDENIPLDCQDAYQVYLPMIDKMTLAVINSSFQDIRISSKYETSTDSIIDKTIILMLKNIVKESHKFWIEEEEWRQREIKTREKQLKIEELKKEAQKIEKLKLQEIEKQQFEEASWEVFENIILTLVTDLSERWIYDERKRHKKRIQSCY